MVASAPDAANYDPVNHSTVALAMETMYGYTAYFPDNDPRLVTPPVHNYHWRYCHSLTDKPYTDTHIDVKIDTFFIF